jgi:hypothetical protein
MMPYTKMDIFREKEAQSFAKSLGATDFYRKMGQK